MIRNERHPRTYAGTYIPKPEQIFGNKVHTSKFPPEIAFVREVDTNFASYLEDAQTLLGVRNKGLGRSRSVGSMALSFVPAKHMTKMIEGKIPGLLKDTYRAELYMHDLAKDYKDFADGHSKTKTAEINAALASTDPNTPGFYEARSGIWGYIDAEILPQMRSVGKTGIAYEVECEQIDEEFSRTVSFLNANGFNTREISRNWMAHITAFDTFHLSKDISLNMLETNEQPDCIPLLPPSARVVTFNN